MKTTASIIAVAAPLFLAASLATSRPAAAQNAPAAAAAEKPAASSAAALVGKAAPDFTLPDQTNESRSLSKHRGKWVVLAFIPPIRPVGERFKTSRTRRVSTNSRP